MSFFKQQPMRMLYKKMSMFKALFLCVITVDRLQTHWEDSQTKLSDRTKQLHNMLQDSSDWLDSRNRVDHLIKQASDRLESWQEITYTVDAVKKQNAELKVGSEPSQLSF